MRPLVAGFDRPLTTLLSMAFSVIEYMRDWHTAARARLASPPNF